MSRPRSVLIIAFAALFAFAACGDDDGESETDNQNDFNVGEPDAGHDDTGTPDDAGQTDDAGDVGDDADTGNGLVVPEDTGQDEDTGDDEPSWPDEDDHSDPPAEPECMETLDHMNACGGYGKGKWENGEVCTDFEIEDALAEFGCTNADIRKFDYWVADGSGFLELGDDTYERDLQIVIDADAFIPENCLNVMGMELTCDDFSAGAEQFLGLDMDCEIGDAEPPEGPGCECVIDEQTLDRSGSGVLTVEADDNILRFSGEGTYYYCAEDGVLNLRTTSDQDLPMTESYTFAP